MLLGSMFPWLQSLEDELSLISLIYIFHFFSYGWTRIVF